MSSFILDGIMGLAVADALGVPVEFIDRNTLMQNPVKEMKSFGTYSQPAGTWSDGTTMTLSLVDSLIDGLDYHDVSLLTHGHKRRQMACGIYISIAPMLLNGDNLETDIHLGIDRAMNYYRNQKDFHSELSHFNRLEDWNFKDLPIEEIESSGYVIDTLEAAIWCLFNTKGYKSCVLKAVNLGEDTDTTASVSGGLAGIKYGYKNIPDEWQARIVNKKYIEDLCDKLNKSLNKL